MSQITKTSQFTHKIPLETKNHEFQMNRIEYECICIECHIKGIQQLFFLFVIYLPPEFRQEDRSHSFNCACRKKEEMDIA